MARLVRGTVSGGPHPGDDPGAVARPHPCLSICLRCRDGREATSDGLRGGARLAQAVLQAGIEEVGLTVRGVHCMSQCKRPCAIALSGPDRFTYLFGDLDPERHALDVVRLSFSYLTSPNGFMPRADRPSSMRAGVLGRVPPLGWSGADVQTTDLVPPPETEPSS